MPQRFLNVSLLVPAIAAVTIACSATPDPPPLAAVTIRALDGRCGASLDSNIPSDAQPSSESSPLVEDGQGAEVSCKFGLRDDTLYFTGFASKGSRVVSISTNRLSQAGEGYTGTGSISQSQPDSASQRTSSDCDISVTKVEGARISGKFTCRDLRQSSSTAEGCEAVGEFVFDRCQS